MLGVNWHKHRGHFPPHPRPNPLNPAPPARLLLVPLKDGYVTLRWRGVELQVVCGLDLELSGGSDARRHSLLLLRSGKAWSDQLFLTQPARAVGREKGKKGLIERLQSEARETEGDEGDMALSRAICYLRAMFVFTFTALIQSKNRQGSDKTPVFFFFGVFTQSL